MPESLVLVGRPESPEELFYCFPKASFPLSGEGVASYLIKHMAKLAFEHHKAQEVTVSCFNQNTGGILLYNKLGFRPYGIEQRIDYNGDQVALIHFRIGGDTFDQTNSPK